MLIGTLLKRDVWYVVWGTAGLVWYGTGINIGLPSMAFEQCQKMCKMNPYSWQMVREKEHNNALNLYERYLGPLDVHIVTRTYQNQKYKIVPILQFIA